MKIFNYTNGDRIWVKIAKTDKNYPNELLYKEVKSPEHPTSIPRNKLINKLIMNKTREAKATTECVK